MSFIVHCQKNPQKKLFASFFRFQIELIFWIADPIHGQLMIDRWCHIPIQLTIKSNSNQSAKSSTQCSNAIGLVFIWLVFDDRLTHIQTTCRISCLTCRRQSTSSCTELIMRQGRSMDYQFRCLANSRLRSPVYWIRYTAYGLTILMWCDSYDQWFDWYDSIDLIRIIDYHGIGIMIMNHESLYDSDSDSHSQSHSLIVIISSKSYLSWKSVNLILIVNRII